MRSFRTVTIEEVLFRLWDEIPWYAKFLGIMALMLLYALVGLGLKFLFGFIQYLIHRSP